MSVDNPSEQFPLSTRISLLWKRRKRLLMEKQRMLEKKLPMFPSVRRPLLLP